jgi:hypothetical protein
MPRYALIFLVAAIIAAEFGFGGMAGETAMPFIPQDRFWVSDAATTGPATG